MSFCDWTAPLLGELDKNDWVDSEGLVFLVVAVHTVPGLTIAERRLSITTAIYPANVVGGVIVSFVR